MSGGAVQVFQVFASEAAGPPMKFQWRTSKHATVLLYDAVKESAGISARTFR